MDKNENTVGLFYIDKDDNKYFYGSFKTLEELNNFVKNDPEFNEIEKKKVIVIKL